MPGIDVYNVRPRLYAESALPIDSGRQYGDLPGTTEHTGSIVRKCSALYMSNARDHARPHGRAAMSEGCQGIPLTSRSPWPLAN